MTAQSIGALALKLVGPWAWYQAALKNPAAIGKVLPIHEDSPQQGYYRAKNREKVFEPVAIFYPEGSDQLVAYRNGKEVQPDTVWTFCCRHPVTFQAYQDAIAGKGWADEDAVVAAQIKAPEPTIGDNSGEVSQVEMLKDQIEAALAGMKAYETIKDDKTAEKALSLRNRLNELSKDADKLRTEEKEPHLKASKEVDAKWQPLVKKAKAGADQVRDAIGSWETVKLQQRRAEEKRVEDARRAAEQAAREQQTETAVMEAPKAEVRPDAAPSTVRASYGKAASVSVKVVVKEVTDWSALAVYMSNHPEAQDMLRKLAQRALDAGRTVPGITTEEKAAVR